MTDVVEEIVEVKEEIVFTEVVPTGQTSPHNSFIYKVFVNKDTNFIATVIAQSSTGARDGLSHKFPDAALTYLGKSTFIMQVNG